jgi:hypothetical protein
MDRYREEEPIELQVEEDRAGADTGDTVFDAIEESTLLGGIENDRQASVVRPDEEPIEDPDAERAAEHQRAVSQDRPNVRFNPEDLHHQSEPENTNS